MPALAQTWILVDARANTRYVPLGSAGASLLGPAAVPFISGQINALGRFATRFTMPALPALLGQEVVGQAVTQDGSVFTTTNPDCKEIRD